jgi:hypothetical protein
VLNVFHDRQCRNILRVSDVDKREGHQAFTTFRRRNLFFFRCRVWRTERRQLVAFTTYNWRFVLKSFIPSNTLGRRLILASAGLLLCANGALAAEVVGDAQMQARDLLSGTVGGLPKFADASYAIPTDDRHVPNLDPHEQALDLILGKHFAGTAHQAASLDSRSDAIPMASVHRIRRADIDGQELAQRLLLGTGV